MAFKRRRDNWFRRSHGLASAIAVSKGQHRRRTLSQCISPGFYIIDFQAQIARMGFATTNNEAAWPEGLSPISSSVAYTLTAELTTRGVAKTRSKRQPHCCKTCLNRASNGSASALLVPRQSSNRLPLPEACSCFNPSRVGGVKRAL